MFRGRKYAYQLVFDKENKYTQAVLRDLAKFCRAHETCFGDAKTQDLLEGRRQVWLRIQQYLKLSEDELIELHKVKELTGAKP